MTSPAYLSKLFSLVMAHREVELRPLSPELAPHGCRAVSVSADLSTRQGSRKVAEKAAMSSPDQVGAPKVEVAATHLRHIEPGMNLQTVVGCTTQRGGAPVLSGASSSSDAQTTRTDE